MSEPAVQQEEPTEPDFEDEVEQAIALCDGDVRAALKATLVANAYLERELERTRSMVSAGFRRGRVLLGCCDKWTEAVKTTRPTD